MSRVYNLGVIGGDGIGPEVTEIALEAINRATIGSGVTFNTTKYDLGARRYLATGETLTEADLESLKKHDAIVLGAIGDPKVPSGVLERQLLLKLRFSFDHYVNLRPTKLYPGVTSPLAAPGKIDFVVVREGTEGPYVGNGGAIRVGTPAEVANEVSVNTAYGVERVVRYAFELASTRERKHITLVHKHNVLVHAGWLWQNTVNRVAQEYPAISHDYLHIDAATIFMVTDPSRFDVIVTDNLFGDIITDLAAAIGGGIGLGASGNINPDGTFPSMFEPVHGSAPDIAGKNLADPTAAILSAAMLLEHLKNPVAAARIENAVAADLASRGKQKRSTEQVAASIFANL
ncbi:3-isopropylmalate dehydrogenase [Candidatus Rhodoluna planktonica]|uniref:3-isopropylmalate dehydrogenase n=1 Tax=Candidatus Rhodoluna planktonica TaxID=535712 RepID=A0A1D9DZV2_9MICO|nr:3-isopropylmalate dehydrogenase [Candidatus Rhodoluna planktonica]AOY56337.1 3-isopropylmalate dehydrogenase [Candidatus Rhodoluna planktonica]